MLDNIKGKIIEPAKTPDSNAEQKDDLEFRVINHEQPGSNQSENQEKETLDFDPAGIGDVFHSWRLAAGRPCEPAWSPTLLFDHFSQLTVARLVAKARLLGGRWRDRQLRPVSSKTPLFQKK
jgi:hypothetical protein